ncbi:hypothetical protein [Pseudomonas sp. NPDC086566]|uniref:hypothetical protein n=1 Tax=Pseudomonas sp. NPDC086566 TaxID=3390647 RepID=UPI003D00A7F1
MIKPSEFHRRPICIIEHHDNSIDVLHPQYTAISGDNIANNGKRYLDFGAFCYRHRRKRSPNHHIDYEGVLVDLATFDPKRIYPVSKLIEAGRAYSSFVSATGFYTTIKGFIDWIDSQDEIYHLHLHESMSKAYVDYTIHLLSRVYSSATTGKALAVGSASALQTGARQLIALTTGKHESETLALATFIKQPNRTNLINLKRLGADAQAKTFSALVNFISEAHRILIDGGTFPMRLESPDCGIYYMYSIYQESSKSNNAAVSLLNHLGSCAEFPTWKMIHQHFELPEQDWKNNRIKTNYGALHKKLLENNTNSRSKLRFQIANHAMTAGMLSFIAATGCNLTTVQRLGTDFEIIPSTQGRRLLGIKNRAHGKIVSPEFGARFTPIFKKILAIRTWLLDGRESNRLFSTLPRGTNKVGYVGNGALRTFKTLTGKFYPKTSWVPANQWRKNVSYQYIKQSGGDTVLTAEKLNNREATIRSSYARPALDEYASEISKLFEEIHSAAISRSRNVSHIPVHVNKEGSSSDVTAVGNCVKDPASEPKLASGFTSEAPKPTCRTPETCLFCDHYAVHADEFDIRRLLSLSFIITIIKERQDHEYWEQKFGPTIHRIDEILAAIQDTDIKLAPTVARIRDEVESGYLDPFWAIHLDTMAFVGAVV